VLNRTDYNTKNCIDFKDHVSWLPFAIKCTYPVSWIKQFPSEIKDYGAQHQTNIIIGGWSFWNAVTSGLDTTVS